MVIRPEKILELLVLSNRKFRKALKSQRIVVVEPIEF